MLRGICCLLRLLFTKPFHTWCTGHMAKPRPQVGFISVLVSPPEYSTLFTAKKCDWSLDLSKKKFIHVLYTRPESLPPPMCTTRIQTQMLSTQNRTPLFLILFFLLGHVNRSALPQHQHTSFLDPDVSDRIALSLSFVCSKVPWKRTGQSLVVRQECERHHAVRSQQHGQRGMKRGAAEKMRVPPAPRWV